MAALIGTDGYGGCVFFNRSADYLICRAVVAEVNDFRTEVLHDAAHHVDGGVVPVKQRRGRNHANRPRNTALGFENMGCCYSHHAGS